MCALVTGVQTCALPISLAHELTFAGHPTLGSAHAWMEAGGQPRDRNMIVQECGAGLVKIRNDGERLAFAAPPLLRGGTPTEADIARVAEVFRFEIGRAAWRARGCKEV